MPKPKKTPKARTQKSEPPIPLTLRVLATLIGEHDDRKIRQALTAVRKALREELGDEFGDAIHAYIEQSARTGSFKADFANAKKLEDRLDDDKAFNLSGGIHNAYAQPGLLAGLTFAYVLLTNDGGAR